MKEYFVERSDWEVAGFAVDKQYADGDHFCGLPLIEADHCTDIFPPDEYKVFVAIGYKDMNRIRKEKMDWLRQQGYSFASYVDPSCQHLSTVSIGENCFIMENVVMQPRVCVEDGVFIGSGVCVSHDTKIKECAYIAVGTVIASYVTVGQNCFIGANATINNGIVMADYTLVGAGAYVSKSTTKYGAYLTEHSKNVLKKVESSKEAQKQFFN